MFIMYVFRLSQDGFKNPCLCRLKVKGIAISLRFVEKYFNIHLETSAYEQ